MPWAGPVDLATGTLAATKAVVGRQVGYLAWEVVPPGPRPGSAVAARARRGCETAHGQGVWCEMTAKSDQVKGKAKQVTGIVTGDKNLEAQGNADRLSGENAERIDRVQAKVHGVMDSVEGFVDEGFDRAKDVVDKAFDKAKELVH